MRKLFEKIVVIWTGICLILFRTLLALAAPLQFDNGDLTYNTGAAGYSEMKNSFDGLLHVLETLCKSLGGIIILWGIFELGSADHSHDGTNVPSALKRIVAGAILFAAPAFISFILR